MENSLASRSLITACTLSFGIAALALILFVLPAEYDIDPTGLGQKMGLTALAPPTQNAMPQSLKQGVQRDAVVLTIPAGKGIEYKLHMQAYQKANYQWLTDEGQLYVDLHGEPDGDTTGYFESYTIASVSEMKGSFTAPFTGSHGWYWKNNSTQDIEIQLLFSGDYVIEGLK